MIHRAFILGAGLGSRLRPLTDHRPKPTVPILGRPLLDYVFEHLKSVGVQEVVINTHHCPGVYQEMFENDYLGLKINYSFEKELLDTGGGLKKVEPFFQEGTFLVYNGDILSNGNLEEAIRFHKERGSIATLILIPSNRNPNVALGEEGYITDLRGVLGDNIHPLYTFSGIHILEPEIFKYIPPEKPISMVDVYLALLKAGQKIAGHVWQDAYWRDVGDIKTYQEIHQEWMGFNEKSPLLVHRLGQDGSDRIYGRLVPSFIKEKNAASLPSRIVMKYGREKIENAYYHRISLFLKSLGLPVPEILYADLEQGLLLIEDLGDVSLCKAFETQKREQVIHLYQEVLQEVLKLHEKGVELYEKDPFSLTPSFTERIYRWESRYFEENLLREIFHFEWTPELKTTFDQDCLFLARTLSREKRTLIHRDFQSKNIMIREGKPYFIDFQGMRFGLPAYDLASLLYDPYVLLTEKERQFLYENYRTQAIQKGVIEPRSFEKIYDFCSLQRLMQALGAYGFLGLKKEKPHFLNYIEPALLRLDQVLRKVSKLEGLKEVIGKVLEKLVKLPF